MKNNGIFQHQQNIKNHWYKHMKLKKLLSYATSQISTKIKFLNQACKTIDHKTIQGKIDTRVISTFPNLKDKKLQHGEMQRNSISPRYPSSQDKHCQTNLLLSHDLEFKTMDIK